MGITPWAQYRTLGLWACGLCAQSHRGRVMQSGTAGNLVEDEPLRRVLGERRWPFVVRSSFDIAGHVFDLFSLLNWLIQNVFHPRAPPPAAQSEPQAIALLLPGLGIRGR